MILRYLQQRQNLGIAPCVPYRFILTTSNTVRSFETMKNYRKIIEQDFNIKWGKENERT